MMEIKMELRGRRKRGRFNVVEEDMQTVGVTE